MSLIPVDPKNEASVVTLLEHAAQWLSEAVHRGEPEEIAAVKAQMATAAEATKQLNLSKEIQLDAQEMVRRAEYALGKAIRRGQAEGSVATRGSFGAGRSAPVADLMRPTDFASDTELHGNTATNAPGILALADVASNVAEFNTALDAAKAEGNLSRANVVRKAKGEQTTILSRQQKAEKLADLAMQGYSSRQMCEALGFSRDDAVRKLAREYDIDIPADKQIGGTRRINVNHVVENTATALEGLVMGIESIDVQAVDPAVASQWVASLDDSLKKLRGFANQIRKATQ